MRFQVNRDVFSEAVSFAVKLLPQRTTLPILSGVLIETSETGLTLSAFDYEVSAQTTIVADVEEAGRILVSGRLLADIASRLPAAPVQFSHRRNQDLGRLRLGPFHAPQHAGGGIPDAADRVGAHPAFCRGKNSPRPSPR